MMDATNGLIIIKVTDHRSVVTLKMNHVWNTGQEDTAEEGNQVTLADEKRNIGISDDRYELWSTVYHNRANLPGASSEPTTPSSNSDDNPHGLRSKKRKVCPSTSTEASPAEKAVAAASKELCVDLCSTTMNNKVNPLKTTQYNRNICTRTICMQTSLTNL